MKWAIIAATVLTLDMAGASVAGAEPRTYQLPDETVTFRQALGSEVARNNCSTCHSTDYIAFQPPNQGQAFWEAEVGKMIKVYHAPIEEADAKVIADYLAKTY